MWPDQKEMRLSSVGVSLFVLCLAAGGGAMALTGSRTALVIGALVGLYFLFSIRIADQWEKVAVLRFGRFTGLRGPGLFYMIPLSIASAAMWTSGCAWRMYRPSPR
jgi:hypothetical protein